jgi:hypothetical protein
MIKKTAKNIDAPDLTQPQVAKYRDTPMIISFTLLGIQANPRAILCCGLTQSPSARHAMRITPVIWPNPDEGETPIKEAMTTASINPTAKRGFHIKRASEGR